MYILKFNKQKYIRKAVIHFVLLQISKCFFHTLFRHVMMSVKKNYMERKKCLRNFFWSETPLHNYNLIEDKKITLWNWRTLIFMEKRRIKKDREKIYVAEVRGRRRLTTKKGGIFKSICIQRFIRVTSYFAANKVDISTIIMVTIKQNSRLKSAQIGTIFGSRKLLFL